MVVHDLEQRVLVQVALRLQCLDQLLERQVLVGLGAQCRFARPVEQVFEGSPAVDAVAQHLGVDEEANDVFHFDPVAIGNGNANADVVLSGMTLQQGLEPSQQRHEKGGALALRLALQPRNQRSLQYEFMPCRTIVGTWGPGMIGRKLQYRMLFPQLGAPVGQLPVFLSRFQPVALPCGIVGILDRECRQGGLLPLYPGPVLGGKLADDDAIRPVVRHDVVHRHHQQVLFRIRADERYAQ